MQQIRKIKSDKKGFTLVEALVVTILVGICMFPITGTLQNGLSKTIDFNHKERCQNLSRSRLNEAISILSYEKEKIDLNRRFFYVYLDSSNVEKSTHSNEDPKTFKDNIANDVSEILSSYMTEISYTESLQLNEDSGGPSVLPLYKQGTAGLRAVVVKTTYLSVDNPATATIEGEANGDENSDVIVSLFSLITTPMSHFHQRVYVTDPQNFSIFSLDTVFLNLVKIYNSYNNVSDLAVPGTPTHANNYPWRPCFIAVHPSNNFMAIKCQKKIKLLNINEESLNNGKVYDVFDITQSYAANMPTALLLEDPSDYTKIDKDAKIEFRQDGKFLFFSSHTPSRVWAVPVSNDLWDSSYVPGSALFTASTTWGGLNNSEIHDMFPGEDGNLYMANKDYITWHSMYENLPNGTIKGIKEEKNIATHSSSTAQSYTVTTDRLGKKVFYGYNEEEGICEMESDPYVADPTDFKDYIYTDLNLPSNTPINDIAVSPDNKYIAVACSNNNKVFITTNPPLAANTRPAWPSSGAHFETMVLNPSMTSFVSDQDWSGIVHLLDINQWISGAFIPQMPTSTAIKFGGGSNNISDVATRLPEYLLVGCSGSGEHSIEYVDIHARFKALMSIPLSAAPVDIALNAAGNRVKVNFSPTKKTYDIFTAQEVDPASIGSQGTVSTPKVTYLIDDGAINPDDNFVMIETGTAQGVFAPQLKGGAVNESLPDWDAIDLVAMNDGGFLVLYKHRTVPSQRMLRWYGKIKWTLGGENIGDYKLFASWYSEAHSFPPADSKFLAVSADDSLLAISVAAGVYLYDFRAQNFDQITQQNGLIAQYKSDDGVIESAVNVKLDSPTTDATHQFLLNSFTASETITTMRDYPANIFSHSTMGPAPDALGATKLSSSMRFFGYYLNGETTTPDIGLAVRDGARIICGANSLDLSLGANGVTTGNSDQSNRLDLGTIPQNSSRQFQTEFTSNAGDRGFALMYKNDATALNPTMNFSTGTLFDTSGTYSFKKDEAAYKRIASTSFQPFLFAPVRLKYIDGSGINNIQGIVFSRQVNEPTLFMLDTDNDSIYIQPFGGSLKRIAYTENIPGDGNTDFDLQESDVNKTFTISPDGSKLFFATEGVDGNFIVVVDISEIEDVHSLNATTNVTANSHDVFPISTTDAVGGSNLGRIVAMIEMPQEIKCIATRQFNRVRIRDRYKKLINFADKIANLNIGAVNVDGIYVMGGAEDSDGSARRHVYKYDPVTNASYTFNNKLNKPVRHPAVTSFQNMLISFNGNPGAALSDTTDWVQTYNPKDDVTITSQDPVGTPATDEVIISQQMAGLTSCVGPDSGTAVEITASHDSSNAWKAFDQDTTSGSIWYPDTTGSWVDYDTGHDNWKLKPNRIRVSNNVAITSGGVDDYRLQASHDKSTWVTQKDDSVSENTVDNSEDFTPTDAFRYWRFVFDSSHGGSAEALREIKIIQNGVRKLIPTMTSTSIANPADTSKTITISANDTDASTDCIPWKSFDGNINTGWMTASNANPGQAWTYYLDIDLGMQDSVDMITVTRGDTNNANPNRGIGTFKFQGTNTYGSGWVDVIANPTLVLPENAGMQVFYNPAAPTTNKYRYYRFLVGQSQDGSHPFGMAEFQLYSFTGGTTPPTVERMTKTQFDASNAIKRYRAAACLTPYGPVFSGGIHDGGSPRSSCHIYWPHALDTYVDNTNKSWGAMQDLPSMPGNRVDHCLVYHQGYLYRIGGSTDGTAANILTTIDRFDFNLNSWAQLTATADADGFTDTTGAFARRKAAACSHGDEIFIFGGYKNNAGADQAVSFAAAWNPATNRIRILSSLPTNSDGSTDALRPINISAVPCGPHIYLIGGSVSENGSGGKQIIRYTP